MEQEVSDGFNCYETHDLGWIQTFIIEDRQLFDLKMSICIDLDIKIASNLRDTFSLS